MDLKGEAVEAGGRLAQVRRTKMYLMIVQVVIVLAAVILFTIMAGNIQLKSAFYYDIGSFIYFVILMAFVVAIESFAFRLLELKYTRSTSAKYFMLKTSMKRGIIVMIVALVVIVFLMTPFLSNGIANFSSESGKTAGAASFYDRDPLGLTTVDKIHVTSNQPAEVLIISEQNYLTYVGSMTALKQHSIVSTSDSSGDIDLAFPHLAFGKYYIVVNSPTPVEVTYTVHKTLSPTFVDFVTFFAILFIAAYFAWVLATYRINKNYAKDAIYR